jgi:hypothetical protein
MQPLPNYELLEVLTEEEPSTFKARQVSSGRTVLLHRLSGGRSYPDQVSLIRTVVRYLRRTSTASHKLVLDMVEHEGAMYLVTEVLLGFRTFNQWLASEMKGLEETQADIPQVTAPISVPSPEKTAGHGPLQPVEAKPDSLEVGEFTRMFQGPGVVSPPPGQGNVAQPGSEKVRASPEPRSSTEISPAPGGDKSTPPATEVPTGTSEQVAAPPDAGEFTRIFQPSAVEKSKPVSPEVPEVPSGYTAGSPEPGELTRVFQASVVDKPRPHPGDVPASMSETVPGEFTAIFKSPAGVARPGGPDIETSNPKEVGDFTRIFGSPGLAQPSSEQLPSSRPTEPPAPSEPAHAESTSEPQVSAGAGPQQPVAQPSPKIPAVSAPKVPEKPPLPAPKVHPLGPPKIPDKASLPTPPAQLSIPHAPPSITPPPALKVPQTVPSRLPQPELSTSDERTSYLPWILILGGLVLAGVVLIVYVFMKS